MSSTFRKEKDIFLPVASLKLTGILSSSTCIPRSPATSARSVPCPLPVAANEPCIYIFASATGSPRSLLDMSPILTAPAVCELDGPTITGPIISIRFIFSHFPPKLSRYISNILSLCGDCTQDLYCSIYNIDFMYLSVLSAGATCFVQWS